MCRTRGFLKRTQNAVCAHRRRAREASPQQHIDYGVEDLRTLVLEAMHTGCRYCGCALTEQNFSCDHATPTSRGGSYRLWNVEITCKSCNEAKGVLSSEEFALLWQALREMSSEGRVSVIRRLRAGGRALSGR